MSRDFDLQQNVIDALVTEPGIDPADIGVTVVGGVVSLHGFVGSHAEKLAAERAAQRISGVEAIAEELHVRRADEAHVPDHEIALRIRDAFRGDPLVPDHAILIKVEAGAVTLSGRVSLESQKHEAARAAAGIGGILTVFNEIQVLPEAPQAATQETDAPTEQLSRATAERGGESVEGRQGQIGW